MQRGLSNVGRMKQLGELKPSYSFGFRWPGDVSNGFLEVLPFRKSWPAIAFMTVFTGAFSIPLFSVLRGFGDNDDLFDLASNLFTLFWALGWSTGVLFLVLVLLAFLFAREVLIVTADGIRLRIEIFNFGLESTFRREYISNLRHIADGSLDGASWRRKCLAFDYMDVPVSLGSDLDSQRASLLCGKINAALGQPIPLRLPDSARALLERQQADYRAAEDNNRQQAAAIEQPLPAESTGAGSKASIYLLVLANLVPLAGVFFLAWQVADIMLLFWFESAIIGFFNILKMFRISGLVALFYSLFFIGHFGAFMAGHLLFIFALFMEGNGPSASPGEVLEIFKSLWPAILALFISHGFSYKVNFVDRQEFRHLSIKQQMGKPYTRILLMHLTIIFGGFLTMVLNAKIVALVVLIALKIMVDLKAHNREHLPA